MPTEHNHQYYCYFTQSGVMGLVDGSNYQLFASESDYYDYIREDNTREDD